MDLQYSHPTNKVDTKWLGARIRLSAKAIYHEFGLQGLCDFWTFMLTETFSLKEHDSRDDFLTPDRCAFCGCPIERKAKRQYCTECSKMLDKVILV